MAEAKIVEAVGVASGTLTGTKGSLSKAIEAAMSQAVLDASEAGITDPDEVRACMLKARDLVKAEFAAQAAKEAAAANKPPDGPSSVSPTASSASPRQK